MKMARRSEVLDLAVEGKAKKKSRKGLIVGIAMLGVIPVIGSTLAASISLNGGSDIEFGQGTQAVVACDQAVTVGLVSAFATSVFELDGIRLSNFDTTACASKSFTAVARDASGAAISGGTVTFTLPASGTTISTISGATAGSFTAGTTADITFTLSSTVAASGVSRITLESSN